MVGRSLWLYIYDRLILVNLFCLITTYISEGEWCMGISMFVSILGTIVVLILTIITITKGYGYKHTVDELPSEEEEYHETYKTNESSR